MAPVRTVPAQHRRRHADRPRPWSQFPTSLLGMAFFTALFLGGYQSATTPSYDEQQDPFQQSSTP